MAVSTGTPRQTLAATIPPIPIRRRLYGFGSIYGKTIRDSRLAFIIAAGLFGSLPLVLGAAIGSVFPTPAARLEVDKLIGSLPASMVNLFGNATLMGPKLGTLGGYMSWKYGALFALGAGLWSILALSGTLAGESARGSLDFVAAVRAAAAWFDATKLNNVAFRGTGAAGRMLVPAPGSGPIWSRYYEIGTDRPIFGDRDKSIHDNVNEISRERRQGYSWFNDNPKRVLEHFRLWSRDHPA